MYKQNFKKKNNYHTVTLTILYCCYWCCCCCLLLLLLLLLLFIVAFRVIFRSFFFLSFFLSSFNFIRKFLFRGRNFFLSCLDIFFSLLSTICFFLVEKKLFSSFREYAQIFNESVSRLDVLTFYTFAIVALFSFVFAVNINDGMNMKFVFLEYLFRLFPLCRYCCCCLLPPRVYVSVCVCEYEENCE